MLPCRQLHRIEPHRKKLPFHVQRVSVLLLQELFQLAHEHEDFGPTPFWVYPMLAIPAPTVVYLMLSGSLGETGTHYLDGSNTPVGQPKKEE